MNLPERDSTRLRSDLWNCCFLHSGLIALVAAVAFANSLSVPFLFDDIDAIVENTTIRQLWPLGVILNPPPQTTVAGRPVLNLTLALCYAMSGLNVWSYHAFNMLLHAGCGLLLFALVSHVLKSPRLASRWGDRAELTALCIALLWVAHPLQTMCVTYVIQRAESLVSFFILVTLYASIRALEGRGVFAWKILAIAACALGMGCKELMVVTPALVIMLDYVLFFDSLRAQFRRRWPLYLGLVSTWLLLIALIATGPRSESAGLNLPFHRPLDYLRTQPQVILHYLRLIVWPHPLVLDYEWPLAYRLSDAAGSIAVILSALLITAWGVWRRMSWSLLPAWFFLILAPTSSFVPIVIVASEHRVYLPMAAVVTSVVLIGGTFLSRATGRASRKLAVVGVTALCVTLAFLTHERNKTYRDGITTWSDVVSKRPHNPRAHMNLAANLHARGQMEDAMSHLHTAIRLMPGYADAHYNLGTVLADLGRLDEAISAFHETIRLKPSHAAAHYNLGHAFMIQGRHAEALAPLRRAVELKSDHTRSRADLGVLLALLGRSEEAVPHLRVAVRLDANNAATHNTLAWILATHPRDDLRNGVEAVRLATTANRLLDERDPGGLDTLAAAYAEAGRFDEAIQTIDRAIALATHLKLESHVTEYQARRDRYQRRLPCREQPVTSSTTKPAVKPAP